MMRALITAGIVAAGATHFGATSETALGYGLVVLAVGWYLAPVWRRLPGIARRSRQAVQRRRSSTRARRAHRPAPRLVTPAPAQGPPALTQVNHHHHYYDGVRSRPAHHRNLLGIPEKGRQQIAHDIVFRTIDE
jgi:hypothetical protein